MGGFFCGVFLPLIHEWFLSQADYVAPPELSFLFVNISINISLLPELNCLRKSPSINMSLLPEHFERHIIQLL